MEINTRIQKGNSSGLNLKKFLARYREIREQKTDTYPRVHQHTYCVFSIIWPKSNYIEKKNELIRRLKFIVGNTIR